MRTRIRALRTALAAHDTHDTHDTHAERADCLAALLSRAGIMTTACERIRDHLCTKVALSGNGVARVNRARVQCAINGA